MTKTVGILTIAALIAITPTQTLDKIRQCIIPRWSDGGNSSVGTCAVIAKELIQKIFLSQKAEEESYDGILLPETGLEFLQDDSQLKFNETFYFNEVGQVSLDLSPVEVVQRFIRDLKAIPSTLSQEGISSPSGEGETKPDWTYLPYRMKDLVEVEEQLYQFLKDRYEQNDELLPFLALESYFTDFEESTLKALTQANSSTTVKHPSKLRENDPYLYATTHPLLVYRMVRRFAEELPLILLQLVAATNSEDFDLIGKFHEKVNSKSLIFPDRTDLEVMWKSISRIQNEVNLKTAEFASGKFEDVDTGLSLNALHALEIGMYYIEEKQFDFGLEWIQLSTETLLRHPIAQKSPFVAKFLHHCMKFAVEKHNQNWEERHIEEWFPGVYNAKVSLPFNAKKYKRMYQVQSEIAAERRNESNAWNVFIRNNFYQTCSGINLQSEEEKASLKCWYEHKSHPYWYINPLKIELLHKNPVFQIHDFLQDALMERIKRTAKHALKRSTVVDKKDPKKSKVESTRTSTQAWLYDDSEPFLKPLTERFEFLSGLRISPLDAHDAYQVALYGPSHHYEAHIDSFEDKRRTVDKGNRIITLMGYLNDVDVGGRTGFPVLGIYAPPRKGSVVMWYNVLRNVEDRDMNTWHGGCPVVLGVKWITNKWVYAWENMFHYKCSLKNPSPQI